jgi:micrococcal nuclease
MLTQCHARFIASAGTRVAIAIALTLFASNPSLQAQDQTPPATPAAEPETCTLEPGPVKTAARVIDGETIQLDDGSEVRLIGALAPRARDAAADASAWPAEQDAIAALTELVLGRSVKLAYGGRKTDRYGRHVAHLFVETDGTSQWVQGAMLSAGHARVYGLPENFACARELYAHEDLARQERRGIWSIALYRPKPAALPGPLLGARSTFQIVEGRVTNVSRTKSAVYLNFGSDWNSDFTVRIGKPVLSRNAQWAAALETLKDRDVSVRGWIERRNGPMIEAFDPSQIEVLDWGAAPPIAQGPPSIAHGPPPVAHGPLPVTQGIAPLSPVPAPETTSTPAADGANTGNPVPGGPAVNPPAPPSLVPRPKNKRPEPRVPGAVNL